MVGVFSMNIMHISIGLVYDHDNSAIVSTPSILMKDVNDTYSISLAVLDRWLFACITRNNDGMVWWS
jgi:hypothetical protein